MTDGINYNSIETFALIILTIINLTALIWNFIVMKKMYCIKDDEKNITGIFTQLWFADISGLVIYNIIVVSLNIWWCFLVR